MSLPYPELGASWRAARSVPTAGFLDAARCNIPSDAVLRAQQDQHRRERELGGYEAEADAAEPLATLRCGLAALLDAAPQDVGLVQSGTLGVQLALFGLRLPAGTPVVVSRAEYASNRLFVDDLARRRGWPVQEVSHDAAGVVDLPAIARALAAGAGLVLLSHVASQRGDRQPAAEVGALTRAYGALFVLDVAQSLGQLDCTGIGADVYVGTSRKWLAGPRGVGFVVAPAAGRDDRVDAPHTAGSHGPRSARAARGQAFEADEADIGGRLGLAQAVAELRAAGPARVFARLAALGAATREVLDGAGGWQVRERGEPTAIISLQPPAGVAVEATVAAARAAGVRVGVVPQERAVDLEGPVLRVSPSLGAEPSDLERLARVLATR